MCKRRLNIALVAHDARKQELIDWCRFNMDTLLNHDMVATGTTSKLIKEMFMENDYPSEYIGGYDEMKRYYDYKVKSLLSGPLGGDQQIGAMIARGR